MNISRRSLLFISAASLIGAVIGLDKFSRYNLLSSFTNEEIAEMRALFKELKLENSYKDDNNIEVNGWVIDSEDYSIIKEITAG